MQVSLDPSRSRATRVVFSACCLLRLVASGTNLCTVAADEPSETDPPSVAELEPAVVDEHRFLVHEIRSEYQADATKIRVLLPDSLDADRFYPVLYVLPVEAGEESRYGDGLLECQRCDIANKYQWICVAPTFSALPWYADHPTDPELRQESYFLETVIPAIEATYPTQNAREGRFLVGFSKSGWGAFSLILRHPDLFARAAAWDAPLMMERPDRYGMGPIFGTQDNFEMYCISSLFSTRATDASEEFSREPARLIHLASDNFLEHHMQAHALMKDVGLVDQYRDGPRGVHDWHSGWLAESVDVLAAP